jgi:hypothetical protein
MATSKSDDDIDSAVTFHRTMQQHFSSDYDDIKRSESREWYTMENAGPALAEATRRMDRP